MSIHNAQHLPGTAGDATEQAAMQKEILRLNRQLQERNDLLESANKVLEGLASTAAHDLRSRLSVIGAYAGLLEKHYGDALDARGASYLKTIRRNVRQTGALVNDLHAFSRWMRKTPEAVPVDMDALVRAVVDDAVRALPDDQLPPSTSLGALPPARADAALMRQVWIHLVSNAFKFSGRQPAPVVEISAHTEGGFNIYSVRDNGAGFDMAHAGKLFEAFQRLHDSDDFEGSGLGLATVRQAITCQGGRVWADSRAGEGSVFSFTLPVAAA
ncbi:MAG: ATP-binding protein [Pseudomonadota bacterium]